jgi:RimJ/RimL family protein N-acetyltransferase
VPDVTIRPLVGVAEIDLFCQLPYTLNAELADDLTAARRRPEWMWVALRGDRVLGRVAWWSRPGGREPLVLDVFDIDDDAFTDGRGVELGVRLLQTAMGQVVAAGSPAPGFSRYVPSDWREHPSSRRIVEDRMAALAETGAQLFVERLRLEWRPGATLPGPSGRLVFRPVRDREDLVALMTPVLDGTLDAHSRDDLLRGSAAQVAAEQYDSEFLSYDSPRDWWRVAELPDGRPVGFVIAAHNGYNPIIAYIGVLPEHRGHGYIDDILAEGTRIHALNGVPRIRASTDLGNVPMARAFQRAGYVNFEREITMVWR